MSSTGGTGGTGSSRGSGSNSVSGFLSTLIPLLPVAAVCIAIFLWFRTRAKRIYQPRSTLCTFRENEKSPQLQNSLTGWVGSFWSIPDSYVLSHHSMDSYLFLRFFKVLIVICLFGCLITWPVLFPVNATGHGGQQSFDMLSFSNVPDAGNRYYAHVFIGWIFFAFVMFVVAKESLFFVRLRQAYLLCPAIEGRMSTRTVLFTDIPDEHLSEARLRELFPEVRHVWMASDTKELDELVEEREKLALKLEGAEIKLSKQANKNRLKHKEEPADAPDRFLKDVKRPTHRLKPIIGKKVDTIDYTRARIGELTPRIESQQSSHWQGKEKFNGAAFIEFENVSAAGSAYQSAIAKSKKGLRARAIGETPDQIIFNNLSMKPSLRRIFYIAAVAFICWLIIFWAIPVAFVGVLSNVNYLTTEVPFLSFINDIPSVILGVVTGLLPTILLSILMSLVPIIIRLLMKYSGAVSKAEIELRTQKYYFWFQVIQVFLVTTFTSGAAAAAAQIVAQPSSAVSLLATSLPKASNFFICYFVLYGVALSARTLAQVVPLALYIVLSKLLDNTPRKAYNRHIKVSNIQWGSVYPLYCNLGVIALTYSIIAPLVLGFAAVGLTLLYIVFRYNVFFASDSKDINTQGRNYAMALQQLTTGVYLCELCMIGLFAINTADSRAAIGPLVLMIIALVLTIVFHVLIRRNLKPQLSEISRDLMMQNMDASENRMEEGNMTDSSDNHYINRDSMASTRYIASKNPKPTGGSRSLVQRFINPAAVPVFAPHMSEPVPEYSDDVRREAYLSPSIVSPSPIVWIVHDEMGVSDREKAMSGKVIGTSDLGAWWETGTGKLVCWWQKDGDEQKVQEVPIYQKPIAY